MRYSSMLKTGIFVFRCLFVACIILAFLFLAGIAEYTELWYVYGTATIGSAAIAIFLLDILNEMENELKRTENRRKSVPVPYIKRRRINGQKRGGCR